MCPWKKYFFFQHRSERRGVIFLKWKSVRGKNRVCAAVLWCGLSNVVCWENNVPKIFGYNWVCWNQINIVFVHCLVQIGAPFFHCGMLGWTNPFLCAGTVSSSPHDPWVGKQNCMSDCFFPPRKKIAVELKKVQRKTVQKKGKRPAIFPWTGRASAFFTATGKRRFLFTKCHLFCSFFAFSRQG